MVEWFQRLAASSARVRVEELGRTTEGRPFIAAFISSPENLRALPRYREIQSRLADPRKTPTAAAEALIEEGRVIVMMTCSIHSNEPASTNSAILFAYRLATADDAATRMLLDDTVLILVPSLNPDGVDIVASWYQRTLGTPWEGTFPPELYNKYTGHDNNRDWYMFTQDETRLVVAKLHNAWHPQVVYDLHQDEPTAARMFVPPWLDPTDPNIDPLIVSECSAVGSGMAADLARAGRTGVVIHALYDMWSPSRHYQAYHGGLRILSESASAALASPVTIAPRQLSGDALGYNPLRRSWNFPEPWPGGIWRFGDIIGYQLIAMESCLRQAAERRAELLRGFYEIGRRACARTDPFAFVIPPAQRDPGAARVLRETLRFGDVEIGRAAAAFVADGRSWPAGSWIISMQQPYSSWAKTLLERQRYPETAEFPGGPLRRPYDVTAQTLPLLMGVQTETIARAFLVPLAAAADEAAVTSGAEVLPAADTDSWSAVGRLWKAGRTVWRDRLTGDFSLNKAALKEPFDLPRPRIGVYKSYVPEEDEGWTRWLLDHFGFPHASVRNPDILTGGLNSRFDAIVFPDQTPESIEIGYRDGAMPKEFTGGLGAAGGDGLLAFVRAGGTLVFLNRSTRFAVRQLRLHLDDATAGLTPAQFYSPGSILNARAEAGNPLTWGLPGQICIWSETSPAWAATPDSMIAVRYPTAGVPASGWLTGERHIAGKAALLDIRVGSGHIILFGFRPQYRGQSYQTFKLFFNALVRRP